MDDYKSNFIFDRNLVSKQYTRSRGSGGQNVNKRDTCVILTHIPTGIFVRVEDSRQQGKNEEIAWQRLEDKLLQLHNSKSISEFNNKRNDQIGNGNRGSDKRRTYNEKQDSVVDHVNGKTASLKQFLKGRLDILFC